MAKTGTITLKQGTSKKGNEYTALVLTVGNWSKLYFVDSQFELDYIKQYMKENPTVAEQVNDQNNILNDDSDNIL